MDKSLAVLHDHHSPCGFVGIISTLRPVMPPSTPLKSEALGLHVVHPLSAVGGLFSDEVGWWAGNKVIRRHRVRRRERGYASGNDANCYSGSGSGEENDDRETLCREF